jgi:hypothetical protein
MSNYDAWLQAPYMARGAQEAAMEGAEEAYADHFGLSEDDMAEVDSDVIYDWYESRMQDAAEDAAIERAEARAERDDWDRDDYDDGY